VWQNIFEFWFDKGVDALSINDVHVLYESDDTALDEPATDDEALPVSLHFQCNFILLCEVSHLLLCDLLSKLWRRYSISTLPVDT